MRILFLSHYFPPEVNAPATRTFEHCREWARAGHDVHVVTCVPSHPTGVVYRSYRVRWYQREEMAGITVHRVWTYLAANEGVVKRSLNFLSFVPTAVWRSLQLGPFDVIVGTSPQFFCAVAACLCGSLTRAPWIFEVRDLWPDSISAIGAIPISWPLRLLRRVESRMYRSAARVVCVTESSATHVRNRGADPTRVRFVPNGVDLDFWRRASRERGRTRLGAGDHDILATYVGTVGLAHGLGIVLAVARELRDRCPHLRFVIVGDGAELRALRDWAARASLTNVSFPGLLDRQRAADCVAASDISLVLLRRSELFKTVLPSKMFEAMAAGVPQILAVDGEARCVLERARAGCAIPPEDSSALRDAILRLVHDVNLRSRLGASGRRFVEQEFNRSIWAEKYLSMLSEVARPRPVPALASHKAVATRS